MSKINYGDFDKTVDNLEYDSKIKNAKFELAKMKADKVLSPETAATVVKTAFFALAFFIAYHITKVSLKLAAIVAKSLNIKPEGPNRSGADDDKLLKLTELKAKICGNQVQNIAEDLGSRAEDLGKRFVRWIES